MEYRKKTLIKNKNATKLNINKTQRKKRDHKEL